MPKLKWRQGEFRTHTNVIVVNLLLLYLFPYS